MKTKVEYSDEKRIIFFLVARDNGAIVILGLDGLMVIIYDFLNCHPDLLKKGVYSVHRIPVECAQSINILCIVYTYSVHSL